MFSGTSTSCPGPATASRPGRMRAVSAGSLAVTGVPSMSGTFAVTVAPWAAATFSATLARSANTAWRMPSSKVRMVPTSSTWSGMMLKRTPPWMAPKLSTTGCREMSWRRLTTVCAVPMMSAAATIGSTPPHGRDPCVWRPWTTMLKRSDAAMAGPLRTPICPACRVENTCRPNTASGRKSRNTPWASISSAPPASPSGGPSSAGWNTNSTSPGSASRMPTSASATPIRMLVWASWPQACITPTSWPLKVARACEAKGRPVVSVTGSASMSARSASLGPGRPPLSTAVTPVVAMPVRGSSPSARRCSATRAAVRVSRLPSSGCWWKSRRHATTLSRSASAALPTSARCAGACAASGGAARARPKASRRAEADGARGRVACGMAVLPGGPADPSAGRATARPGLQVVPRQVLGRLHLDQARSGALEGARQPLAGVQRVRGGVGGADQFHVAVVGLVDEGDEAPRGVVAAAVHHRDPAQQHRVELGRDLDVVRRAARALAERGEIEPGHAGAARPGGDAAALQLDAAVAVAVVAAQRVPARFQPGVGPGVQRRPVDRRAGQLAKPVVGVADDLEHLAVPLQQRDRGQEARALQAAGVEAAGFDVGRGHQHDAFGEHPLQQPSQEHGVADVADEELVEHQHPQRAAPAGDDRGQRVALAGVLAQALVHAAHEAVEVGAVLAVAVAA